MKHLRLFTPVLLAVLTAGCTKETPVEPSAESIVVRGYLYADEPVTDIRLTGTLPLGSEEMEAPPINNAEVSLEKNGVRYGLVSSAGDSGYYHYPGDDLTVRTGDVFQIHIHCNGRDVDAESTVPAAPDSVRLSSDSLAVSGDFGGFGPPGGDPGTDDSTRVLTVSWKRESSALYFVVVECMEANPDTIESPGFFQGGGGGLRRMVSSPTADNRYRIQRFNLSYYGRHRVKVYRVNQEYADLFESRQQDSRDLNEPVTNIENGLGVFSAFNSSAAYFEAVQP